MKSLAITPSGEKLSLELMGKSHSCHIGWCVCDKNSPTGEWSGSINPKEYFMIILI